jgi:cytochrome P450
VAEAPALLFNPLDPAFRVNPYPFYARLRAEDPVHRTPTGVWALSRYAGCAAVLRDHARWSSDLRNNASYQRALAAGRANPEAEALGKTPPFLILDPPDHTRLRGLVSKAFTPKVIEGHRARVQELVDGFIDAAAAQSTMELIEDFAYPLPITVICELLGVPAEDRSTFQQWSRELSRGLDPEEVLPPEAIEARRRAGNAFADYFRELIATRRREPRDDLLSALIAAEEEGDKLSEDELVSTCIFLLAAGHETTVNLLGNGTLAFLRHPAELAKLRADPSLARGAGGEVLRYDPPVQYAPRIAMEDVAIDGVTIGRGEQAVVLIGAANRDPAAFTDPDRFDITRGESRHLAFGLGIHFCLGAPLARLQGEVAFATMARRLHGLRLLTERPEYKEHIVNRGLRSLPIAFDAVGR